MNKFLACFFIFISIFWVLKNLSAQNCLVQIKPILLEKTLVLNQPVFDKNRDSITVQTLRFYLGHFSFLNNGRVVFQEKTHRLFDLENEKSLVKAFQIPENLHVDSLQFDLGVDSLTTVAGVMGGDLDPTNGMFWTWQSGYINTKIEGISSKNPSKNKTFSFHLGGYMPPFSTLKQVVVPVSGKEKITITLDLTPFFEQIDWDKKPNIMSPGKEAVRLSAIMAKSFLCHEK